MSITKEAAIQHLLQEAARLIAVAEHHGMVVTIETQPNAPLAMGNSRMVPSVRPGPRHYRQQPAQSRDPYMDGMCTADPPREISDREWAAQPAGLREGCTKHVPGVGDL